MDRKITLEDIAKAAGVSRNTVSVVLRGRPGVSDAVRARETVAFHRAKHGLLLYPGRAYAGKLTVADIGILPEWDGAQGIDVLEEADACALLPVRPADGHKGTFGHVLSVAGSEGMAGAAALCARSALRAGAGLVTAACPFAVLGTVQAQALCATAKVVADGAALDAGAADMLAELAKGKAALAIGPGLGREEGAWLAIEALVRSDTPKVVDADALYLLAKYGGGVGANTVLTPHPGEMARLCGTTVQAILDAPVELAQQLENTTGYEEISLSSLSSGDYTCLAELIRELIRRLDEKHVSISLPSLRLDSVLKDSLEATQKEKKTSLTFAPEAGTQRLRDVINKGVTEEDLMSKVSDAFHGGWSSVKLYFMMGLPTETTEDLDGIADLAKKVVDAYFAVPRGERAKGLRVVCSASVFVPKPFTPFQWEPQDTQEMVREKQSHLREKLHIKGVTFNYHESDLSYLEACFARGDRRMGQVLLRAYQKGCMLDGWTELFKYDMWREAFAELGIDPAFYAYRRREKDEIMPWDVIDCGVTKEFLWREKEKAEKAQTTKDCRKGCNGCGLQRFKGVCKYCG